MHCREKFAHWSIKSKLSLLFLIIFLLASWVIVTSSFKQREREVETAKNNVLLMVQSLAAQQDQIILGTKQMLSTLAQLPEIQNLDANACNRLLNQLNKRFPFYSVLAGATPDGNMFTASTPFEPNSINLSDRTHLKDAINTLDFSAGEYIVGRASRVSSINYAYPVLDAEKKLMAILIAGFKLDEYALFIKNAQLPDGSVVAITDHKGIRLFRMPETDAAAIGQSLPFKVFEKVSGALDHGIFEHLSGDGVYRIYAYKQLRLSDNSQPYMYMFVGLPKDKILATANLEMWRNLTFLGIAALVAITLVWMFANFILVRPIRRLVDATLRFGHGEMDARTQLPHSLDELGKLAKSFDDMASLLEVKDQERQKAVEELKHANDNLEQRVQERTHDLAASNERLTRSTEELQHSFIFQQRLIDALPIPVFYKDLEGRYLGCNSSFENYFGQKWEELIGKSVYELSPKELAGIYQEKDQALLQNPGIQVYESVVKDADGVIRDVILHKATFNNMDGSVGGLIGAFLDITDIKTAEKMRKKLESQLFQAQKMESVGRLAGGVAHDYNNMLTVIVGYTQLALEELTPENQISEYLRQVYDAAIRSTAITRQLLAFARKQVIAPMVLDLNETVESMLKMLRRLIGEDLDLVWRPATGLWSVVMDPSQVDQVLVNLCVNARDAINGVGRVTIETGMATFDEAYCADHLGFIPGEYVLLAISDDGCGMDRETVKKIFEPFFTTKVMGQGTGLGLATVYGIVKQNNGFINVYSEPGEGTTFKIYLARRAEPAGEAAKESPKEVLPLGHGEVILIVEDEASILDLARRILGKLGYTVLTANLSSQALNLAEEHHGEIHLLITDVVMPEMNGKELSLRLQKVYPRLKTLFMSGYTANVIAHRGVLDEGVQFLQKPFSIESMAAKVEKALGN